MSWKPRDRTTLAGAIKCKAQILTDKRNRARKQGETVDPLLCSVEFWKEVVTLCRYCELCGTLLDLSGQSRHSRGLSVDRIDNLKGYTIENTAILCWTCNQKKRDITIDWLKKLLAFMEPRIRDLNRPTAEGEL